jgi:hypothetical protein
MIWTEILKLMDSSGVTWSFHYSGLLLACFWLRSGLFLAKISHFKPERSQKQARNNGGSINHAPGDLPLFNRLLPPLCLFFGYPLGIRFLSDFYPDSG